MSNHQTVIGPHREATAGIDPLLEMPSLQTIARKISVGMGGITAADRGLRQAQELLLELNARLQAASAADGVASVSALDTIQDRLRHAAVTTDDAESNLLLITRNDSIILSIGSALTRAPDGQIALRPIEVDRTHTALFDAASPSCERRGILDRVMSGTGIAVASLEAERVASGDVGYAADASRRVESALAGIKAALSHLSIARSRLDLQASFIASLSLASGDQLASGLGEALDGPALRRVALHTKRLLSEQSGSIASLNRETVLRLFREG